MIFAKRRWGFSVVPWSARRGRTVTMLGLMLTATALSACSASSSSSSSPAASTARPSLPAGSGGASKSGASATSAVAEITADWNAFFSGSTSTSRRAQLLQNGGQFSSALAAIASSPLNSAVTPKVDSVKLISSTQARVKYDLSALGTQVATGASGTAVFQGGTWKVGDDVFCSLVTQANSDGISLPVPRECGTAV